MINRIISEHIKSHKRIVVPGFGAFIRKDTGEVVLVEFLKKDDGVLVSLLTAKEGLSDQEALDAIAQHIAKIKRNVAQAGDYFIEGLGRIYVTPHGLYELEYLGNMADSAQDTPAPHSETPQPNLDRPLTATIHESGKVEPAEVSGRKPAGAATAATTGRPTENAPGNPAPASAAVPGSMAPAPSRPPQVKTAGPANPGIRPPAQQRPAYRPAYAQPKRKKRADLVMIIAVAAAIVALAAMVFKLIDSGPVDSILPVGQPTEQVSNGNI